jgi:fructokinase
MRQEFFVVGESLVDEFIDGQGRTTRVAGGSAHNVAVALTRLGGEVSFATAHADDPDGRMLRQHLQNESVHLVAAPGKIRRTATARVTLDSNGCPAYDIQVSWDLPQLVPTPSPSLLYLTSLAPLLGPGRREVEQLLQALQETSLVVYDLNLRPSALPIGLEWRALAERTLRRSHVVKASDEDLAALQPQTSWQEAATQLLASGPTAVVVTLGASGSAWVDRRRCLLVRAPTVTVRDTVGAGDSYGAALADGLLALTNGSAAALFDGSALCTDDVVRLLHRCTMAGAIAVTRQGANPPTAAELDGALRSSPPTMPRWVVA